MTTTIGDEIMESDVTAVTCRWSPDAAGNSRGAWVCTGLPGLGARLLNRNEALTAIALAERLAAGFGDGDPFVADWRDELGVPQSAPPKQG